MSLPNSFCGGHRARTIQRYCCTRAWLWERPRTGWAKFLPAKEHLEMAITLYDPERHRPLAFRYGWVDAGVGCLSHAARTLWQLGYPDQALKRGNEALALAQKAVPSS